MLNENIRVGRTCLVFSMQKAKLDMKISKYCYVAYDEDQIIYRHLQINSILYNTFDTTSHI